MPYPPPLRLEDEEETKKRELAIAEEDKLREQVLDKEQGDWKKRRTRAKDLKRKELGRKIGPVLPSQGAKKKGRELSGDLDPPRKRQRSRKYGLLEEHWGEIVLEEQDTGGLNICHPS